MIGHDQLCRAKHMDVSADISDLEGCDCALIAKVRADEQAAVYQAGWEDGYTRALADLRVKVEALRAEDPHNQPVRDAYDDVLALLDGAP